MAKQQRTGRGVQGKPGNRYELRDEGWERIAAARAEAGREVGRPPRSAQPTGGPVG